MRQHPPQAHSTISKKVSSRIWLDFSVGGLSFKFSVALFIKISSKLRRTLQATVKAARSVVFVPLGTGPIGSVAICMARFSPVNTFL